MHSENTTGIILAGGKSSRMGRDKAFIDINGELCIEKVIKAMLHIADQLIIIANSKAYQQFGFPVYPDIYQNSGPMAGIHAGLVYTETNANLFVACDMPCLDIDILEYLKKSSADYDMLVAEHDGKVEPLSAFYNKSCVKKIESLLFQGKLKIQELATVLNSKTLKLEEFESQKVKRHFYNLNDTEALKNLEL